MIGGFRREELMKRLCLVLMAMLAVAADKPAKRSPREALQPFNVLIGAWKNTGTPEGTREEKDRGLWVETMAWEWQFKGADAWLKVYFAKGKYFRKGELRYQPDGDQYQLTVLTTGKDTLTFTGRLNDRRLILDRTDEAKNQDQRLVFSLLHANRVLYSYEVKPRDRSLFTRVYRVGATKKGVPFAVSGSSVPECIVSGGQGTIKVTYKGKTYYVCCSGCRAEFNDNPEKYIKEYEEKQAKKAREKAK
jgi:YHS domain-containing protein